MKTLHGIGASAGIGIGKAVCVRGQNLDYSAVQYGGAGAEQARLRKAVRQFSEDIQAMADEIRARVGQKEAEILEGQVTMLSDPFMLSQMEEGMDAGQTAEAEDFAFINIEVDPAHHFARHLHPEIAQ